MSQNTRTRHFTLMPPRDNIGRVLGPSSPRSFCCTGTCCDKVGLAQKGRLEPDNVSHADVVPRPGSVAEESRLSGAGNG